MAFRRTLPTNGGGRKSLLRCLPRYLSSSASLPDSAGTSASGGPGSVPLPPQKTPLSEPLRDLPQVFYTPVRPDQGHTRVTVLANGLKVASEERPGKFCTVGVVVDSGSRYETAYPSGVSHFLEKLSFGATQNYSSRDHILQQLEKYGGICDCQSSRDTFIYATSVESRGLDVAVQVLGDVVLRPQLNAEEIENARLSIQFELQDLEMRPDQETRLVEMLHAAAFRDNTLGLPKLCTSENVSVIDRQTLFTFLRSQYHPSRMALAGVGIEHDALVECAQKYFVEEKAIWEEDTSLTSDGSGQQRPHAADQSVAQYTGGLIQVEKDLSDVSLGPTPMPELAHFVLGVESCSHQHDDFIAVCVLSMLMGGGGSFSAGGPGKGMYTRLYTNVLNRFYWMHNATAYNHAYADSGVFCVHASSHPSQLWELVDIITREFIRMAGAIEEADLSRAKKQLQSMLLMNLESRPVVFEDIGRQVLATGHRKRPEEFMEKIRAIRADDIRQVASRMLCSKPAVAFLGDLRKAPEYKAIESALLSRDGKLPGRGRFSVFR